MVLVVGETGILQTRIWGKKMMQSLAFDWSECFGKVMQLPDATTGGVGSFCYFKHH